MLYQCIQYQRSTRIRPTPTTLRPSSSELPNARLSDVAPFSGDLLWVPNRVGCQNRSKLDGACAHACHCRTAQRAHVVAAPGSACSRTAAPPTRPTQATRWHRANPPHVRRSALASRSYFAALLPLSAASGGMLGRLSAGHTKIELGIFGETAGVHLGIMRVDHPSLLKSSTGLVGSLIDCP